VGEGRDEKISTEFVSLALDIAHTQSIFAIILVCRGILLFCFPYRDRLG